MLKCLHKNCFRPICFYDIEDCEHLNCRAVKQITNNSIFKRFADINAFCLFTNNAELTPTKFTIITLNFTNKLESPNVSCNGCQIFNKNEVKVE